MAILHRHPPCRMSETSYLIYSGNQENNLVANEEVENGDNEDGVVDNEYMEGRITSNWLEIEGEGGEAENSQEAVNDEEEGSEMNQEEAQMDEEEEQDAEKSLEQTTSVEEGNAVTTPQNVSNETPGSDSTTQSARRPAPCTFSFC